MADRIRCAWADTDPLLTAYHDAEWGVPVHDEARLFEALTLEGAQAGLSWLTVLRKRERYRERFHGFDPEQVVRMTPRELERVLADPGIIRHRGKVESTVSNARAVLALQREHGSLDAYLWSFTDADAMSAALKRRGFRFVGATICESFRQATGMVDGHLAACFRATHTQVD